MTIHNVQILVLWHSADILDVTSLAAVSADNSTPAVFVVSALELRNRYRVPHASKVPPGVTAVFIELRLSKLAKSLIGAYFATL